MGNGVRSDELSVLCAGCANPVAGHARCPVCGDASRCSGTPTPDDELDEALLQQVGIALAAEAELARKTAAAHTQAAAGLLGETLALRGRLRRQRMLLRQRVAEQSAQTRGLSAALTSVDEALHTARGLGSGHPDWSLRARLPRDRSCPAVARRLLEGHAREDLDDRQAEAALLIVSELATNALTHGAGAIVLTVSRHGDSLRIEVFDEGRPEGFGVVPEGERRVGGRGLFIVDQLARGWGATAGTGHVWAELALA
jgi:anti-sigma regulatory factor (Ser/Thr protein kinase)